MIVNQPNVLFTRVSHITSATPIQKVICLGDFNATTSAAWFNSSLRENTIVDNLEINDNEQRFHDFFHTCHLLVLNTWFNHRKCRRVTWYHPMEKLERCTTSFLHVAGYVNLQETVELIPAMTLIATIV